MGFFSDLFGGTDDSAQKGQLRQNRESIDFTKEMRDRATADVNRMFPQAMDSARGGFDAALGVLRDSPDVQREIVRSGNLQARNTQRAGLNQVQNAILGLPIDMGAFAEPTNQGMMTGTERFADTQLPPSSMEQQPMQQGLPDIQQAIDQGLITIEDLMQMMNRGMR
jgi:hypothetical protein